jgi:hypothetical protein
MLALLWTKKVLKIRSFSPRSHWGFQADHSDFLNKRIIVSAFKAQAKFSLAFFDLSLYRKGVVFQ